MDETIVIPNKGWEKDFSRWLRRQSAPLINRLIDERLELVRSYGQVRRDKELLLKCKTQLAVIPLELVDELLLEIEQELSRNKQRLSSLCQAWLIWDEEDGQFLTADPWLESDAPWRRARWARLSKKHKDLEEQVEFRLLDLRYGGDCEWV